MKLNHCLLSLLLGVIHSYQKFISPWLPARCRYYPTCSKYGYQALSWHGVWQGSYLLIKRLLRCQPCGGSGIDFVPVPLWRYHYFFSKNRHHFVFKDQSSYIARLNHLMKN